MSSMVGAVLVAALWSSAAPGSERTVSPPVVEPPCSSALGCGAATGRVRIEGERRAVVDARIVVMPASDSTDAGQPAWTRTARTDADGRFTIVAIPVGDVQVIVLSESVQRATVAATIVRDATIELDLFAAASGGRYRTIVRDPASSSRSAPPSTRVSRIEMETMPGTQGDALRGLQSLPGVARPPAGLGFLVLRGAPPWQSLTLVGEHPVPRAFHALPLAGVLPTEAIEEIELVPSNASARYGGISGGMMRISPRRPATDAVHGHAKLDIMGVDASAHGPLGKARFYVGARRGWADVVLARAQRITGASFLLPGLWDYQAWVVVPHRRAEIEARLLGAGDRVRMESPFFGRVFEYRAQFHRADLVGRWRLPKARILLTPSFRFQDDRGERRLSGVTQRRDFSPGWRAEVAVDLAPQIELVMGSDGQIVPYQSQIDEDVPGGGFPPDLRRREIRGTDAHYGAYSMLSLQQHRWRITPGVRVQAAHVAEQSRAAVDPRLSIRWDVHDAVRIRIGAGRYSQSVGNVIDRSDSFSGNVFSGFTSAVRLPTAIREAFEPRVVSPELAGLRFNRSWQTSTTAQVQLPWDLDLRVTGFFRHTRDPGFFGPIDLEPLSSSESDRVVRFRWSWGLDAGGEVLLRKRLSRNLHGWIAYTGMRSFRWVEGRGRRRGSFDQPHNLLAVASYALPRGWRLGARFRVASGNPYTPIVGTIESTPQPIQPGPIPLHGRLNSARFPTFHQLDVRVDKTWTRPRAKIRAYLDIQNVYNRENVEAWIYQPDLRTRARAFGLPVFPTLGVRVDY